jgi:hypothetical protein
MWLKGENGLKDNFLGRKWGWGEDVAKKNVGLGKY